MADIADTNPRPKRRATIHSTWSNSVYENFYEAPDGDPSKLEAWCYLDKLSYAAGDTVKIHTNTTGVTYDLTIYRDGAKQETVWQEKRLEGRLYETPRDCSINGCGWPVAKEFSLPSNWRSGGYIIHIHARDKDGITVDHHFPFFVRAKAPTSPDAILLIACTGTWVAYNEWGGSNVYEGIEGPEHNKAAHAVTTLRPFSRGFAWLPEDAPRIPFSKPPKMGAAIRYPHMEWAYANGFSKKYASAGWATYERHFVRWAENAGFTVDTATQHDLHAIPGLLTKYKCVVIVGHDEYWSWEMRDAIEAYVEAGGNVARFGGNFGWQIRLEEQGTRLVCYKADAEHEDPVRNDPERKHLLTAGWEDVLVKRPGTLTFGLNGSCGVYAGWGGCIPRGSGGFTVYRPEHWAFAGTDLYYGDLLGAESKAFGYEVDGCDYTFKNGLPYATSSDGAPKDLEILAMGLATTFEADHGNPGSTFFMGPHDAKGMAHKLYRRDDPETIDRVKRGSGMIATFRRGAGTIFNAASCEWVAGLIGPDPFVARTTSNVLSNFIGRV